MASLSMRFLMHWTTVTNAPWPLDRGGDTGTSVARQTVKLPGLRARRRPTEVACPVAAHGRNYEGAIGLGWPRQSTALVAGMLFLIEIGSRPLSEWRWSESAKNDQRTLGCHFERGAVEPCQSGGRVNFGSNILLSSPPIRRLGICPKRQAGGCQRWCPTSPQ